jgi:biotin-(acetyl-CoA carboxylase) ligase
MKVAGTIAEATSLGDTVTSVLLGIGLNANFHTNQIGFANASTLLDILGSWVDREQLISSILLSIERLYCKACLGKTAELLDLLSEHDGSLGRRAIVRFDRETIEGILKGYQTLTSVRIVQQGGSTRILETSSVISVDYSDV